MRTPAPKPSCQLTPWHRRNFRLRPLRVSPYRPPAGPPMQGPRPSSASVIAPGLAVPAHWPRPTAAPCLVSPPGCLGPACHLKVAGSWPVRGGRGRSESVAPWGAIKDLPGYLLGRTHATWTPGRGRHYGKPISVRRKRKGWRMPPGRRRAERSSRRGEAEDGAAA